MEREFTYYIDPGIGLNSSIYHCNDGFSYYLNGKFGNEEVGAATLYLRCTRYTTAASCRGRAIIYKTPEGDFWTNTGEHVCAPDNLASAERLFRHEVLQTCRTRPYESPRDLLFNVSLRYPQRVLDRVNVESMRNAMRDARLHMYPLAPDDLDALGTLLEDPQYINITKTINGNDFIHAGTVGPPGHQSTIFFSKRMRRYCNRGVQVVFADATFVPTPVKPAGAQVYQIVTVVRNKVIPLVQAIMENKSYESYLAVLQAVKRLAPRMRPRLAMMDYERNPIKAWRTVFRCSVKGCYFHFVKAVLKKMKRLGLTALLADRNARSLLRSFLGLPLLPTALILRAFFVLLKRAMQLDLLMELETFIVYFIGTWLTGYRFQCLSVYNEPHRTNNATEAANRILRINTGPHHPNIWQFINAIKKYEWSSYKLSRRAQRGFSLGRRSRLATLENDEVIRNCSEDVLSGNISIWRFLRVTSTRVLNVFHATLRVPAQ